MANFFKTGVQTVAVLVVRSCRIYDKYAPSFNAFVDASSLTSDEKASVHACMAAIGVSCEVFRKLTKLA